MHLNVIKVTNPNKLSSFFKKIGFYRLKIKTDKIINKKYIKR